MHEELVTRLGQHACHWLQIKTELQKFRNGDLSCKGDSCPRWSLLILESQFETVRRKYPFAPARDIAQHFSPAAPTITAILHRELGMRKSRRRWMPHFLSKAPKTVCVEALKEMLRILQDP
jgi:hypothetical protein